jgi:hypothetical protein
MLLYTDKIENGKLGFVTPNEEVAKSQGWEIAIDSSEVVKGYDGDTYLKGYEPVKSIEQLTEEARIERERRYLSEVDPITSHINRLRDEEQTPEVIADIERLKAERAEIVAKIKEENPYPKEII